MPSNAESCLRSWYHSAQSVRTTEPYSARDYEAIDEVVDEDNEATGGPELGDLGKDAKATPEIGLRSTKPGAETDTAARKAQTELNIHELLALFSCFLAPLLGAWLLHALRAQLSRPSEGLVSDYNLTIFLLATEVRPLAHLMKMVQKRTLYLQKAVSDGHNPERPRFDNEAFSEILKRVEELEQSTSNAVPNSTKRLEASQEVAAARAFAQATADLRKGVQPELDALNRAVRRYEKRTTISAIQTEARLQDLETRLRDVVVLAAAAQRNVENQPRNYIVILTNWVCGAVVLPLQYIWYLLSLPSRASRFVSGFMARQMRLPGYRGAKEPKSGRQGSLKARDRRIKSDA